MSDNKRAKEQARAQLESIKDMINRLHVAEDDPEGQDGYYDVCEEIRNDPLSVQVRSDWHCPSERSEDTEYQILLCTGGPAVRIIGDLNDYNEAETARIEYQDWFTQWEELPMESDDENVVREYSNTFLGY